MPTEPSQDACHDANPDYLDRPQPFGEPDRSGRQPADDGPQDADYVGLRATLGVEPAGRRSLEPAARIVLAGRHHARGGWRRGLNAGRRDLPRSELDVSTGFARRDGAKGLVWAFVEQGGWRSPVAKCLSPGEIAAVNERLDASEGDLLLAVADSPSAAGKALASAVRVCSRGLADADDCSPPGLAPSAWPTACWPGE